MRSAADIEDLTGDEVGVVSGEERYGAGNVVGSADTPSRDRLRLYAQMLLQSPPDDSRSAPPNAG